MSSLLLQQEIEAANKYLDALRWHAKHGKKLGFFELSANSLFSDGRPIEAPRDRAQRYLSRFEKLMSDITAKWDVPAAFNAVESALGEINTEIAAMLPKHQINHEALNQALSDSGVGALFFLNALMADREDMTTHSALGRAEDTFAALGFCKKVLHCEVLQDRRDDLFPNYLKEALALEQVVRKVEIRRREDQLEKLLNVPMPTISLFTTRSFKLPNVFVRQRRFLENLIADLTTMQNGAGDTRTEASRQKSIEELERKIRQCDSELQTIRGNDTLDEYSKDRRSNIVQQRREDLYERLENLYREDQ